MIKSLKMHVQVRFEKVVCVEERVIPLCTDWSLVPQVDVLDCLTLIPLQSMP